MCFPPASCKRTTRRPTCVTPRLHLKDWNQVAGPCFYKGILMLEQMEKIADARVTLRAAGTRWYRSSCEGGPSSDDDGPNSMFLPFSTVE